MEQWSNGANSSSINNLTAGNYTLTLSDANGCDVVQSFIISTGKFKSQIIVVKNVSAVGAADAELVAWSTGGTTPLTYSWSDPANQTTRKAVGLSAGTYAVTITDANACTQVSTMSIGSNACPISITPNNLSAKYLSTTSAFLDWEPIIGTNIYYMVRTKESGQSNWQTFFTTSVDSFQLSGLSPNTSYLYMVRTNCNGSWGQPSWSYFKTLTLDCSNPTGVAEQWVLGTQTKLVWSAASNTSQYEIRYKDTTTNNWTNFFVNANFNYHWLSGLSNLTTYEWQIRSLCRFDSASAQRWSTSRIFTTKGNAFPSQTFRKKAEIDGQEHTEAVTIFPNPNKGEFTIRFDHEVENTQIRLTDINGRKIYEGGFSKQNRIDLNPQIHESGVYLLFIQEGEKQVVKRLVIQK